MASPLPTPDELPLLGDDDRGPILLGVSWILASMATTFLSLRIYCKVIVTGRRLWWDDWILIGGWFAIIATNILTTVLVTEFRLGQHNLNLDNSSITKFLIALNSRATVTITAIAWTKTAFAVTLLRLTTGAAKHFVWFIIVTLTIFGAVSAMVPWIQCGPLEKTWNPAVPGTCWAPGVGTNIWIATGAHSAAMDFVLAALPWTFLWQVLLNRRERLGILVAMSMGAVAGVVAIFKCLQLPQLGSGDSYKESALFLWDIAESNVTLMAACIPTLRVLFRDVRKTSNTSNIPRRAGPYFVSPKRRDGDGQRPVRKEDMLPEGRIV
ncbi:hypothetical protein QBC39DRAFT_262389 [Podospora conica]|nr:hypothetical protein QBC39DRAFT_262389 [Schizothecium conicum]